MKQTLIVLLSLGLVGAFANTIKQADSNNKLPEPSDSDVEHNGEIENTLNKIAIEQKDPVDSSVDTGLFSDVNQDDEITLAVEEIIPSGDLASLNFDPPTDVYMTDIPEFPIEENNFYRSALPENYQDEIMDVAASWAPPPFFRRQKQKARRRFSAPRHFAQNPYRRFHYYPYYAFYRPRPYFY